MSPNAPRSASRRCRCPPSRPRTVELLKSPPAGEETTLVDLITHRVPAGVDDAAKVKASYLAAVAHGTESARLISREKATELLGTMLGGYNISPLVDLLDDAAVAVVAAKGSRRRC
jgi:aconitate hydratase 2/2-methylisocitrate dehydratase